MSQSDTSSSDSDSASDSDSSSSDEEDAVKGCNLAPDNHDSLTAPHSAEAKEPSWSLKNFLPPDKPENDKISESPNNSNDVPPSLFSNDENSASDEDENDERSDVDESYDELIRISPSKPIASPSVSRQTDHNLLAVHHRIANKSPKNYITKSPDVAIKTPKALTQSPVTKVLTPVKIQPLLSPIKNVLLHSPKRTSSSLESTPKKSSTKQESKSSSNNKQRKRINHLSEDSSDDARDRCDESDIDVVGITPVKRTVLGSNVQNRCHKPEPTNFCQKLDFNKSKSSPVDFKPSPTVLKQSPSTPTLNSSLSSEKHRDRSRSKHKSKHKSIKSTNEKDQSIERIMDLNSVKTERILSPIHDSECGVGSIGSVGSVCYDSDGKATIVVKLNLTLLDNIPILKETNLNVNLISPDSGISVSSNAGPPSNTHPGNLDSLDLKDDEKCMDLLEEHFVDDDIKDVVTDDKVSSYNKDCFKKDNKLHDDKERTIENHKIKYRDKDKQRDSSLHDKTHHKTSSTKDSHVDKNSEERCGSKESSKSVKHDESSHRSCESRSKHRKRGHDSVHSKDAKRSRPSSETSSSSSRKRNSPDTASQNQVPTLEPEVKIEVLSPAHVSSDALTCHITASRAKKPRQEAPPLDSFAKSQSKANPSTKAAASPSNQPVNQNPSSNATDKGENWSLDRRRSATHERLLSADEYLADARRLKHEADSLTDRLVKSLTYTEAVLCFILCGYAMERDNISEANRIFSMYKDTLRLIISIYSKFRSHSNDTDVTGKDKRLTVLSLRIQSLLSLKLYTLKKPEALKLKRVIDDHNKINGSHSQRAVTAPSPAQAGWTGRSTGTPSPMSPTPSPAGSIGSVGSQGSSAEYNGNLCNGGTHPNSDQCLCTPQGSSAEYNGKLCNGGTHPNTPGSTTSSAMTSPGYVNVPQRIHSVTQQYLSNMHYLVQCHELWDQADQMANDCKEFFESPSVNEMSLSLHSDIWQLVQFVRHGLSLLKDS